MRNGNGKGTQQDVGKRGGGVGGKAVGQKRHRFADVNAARQAGGDGRKDKRDKNVDFDQAKSTTPLQVANMSLNFMHPMKIG